MRRPRRYLTAAAVGQTGVLPEILAPTARAGQDVAMAATLPPGDELIERLTKSIAGTDAGWDAAAALTGPGDLLCREGCFGCCIGTFEISLPEALVLRAAVFALPRGTASSGSRAGGAARGPRRRFVPRGHRRWDPRPGPLGRGGRGVFRLSRARRLSSPRAPLRALRGLRVAPCHLPDLWARVAGEAGGRAPRVPAESRRSDSRTHSRNGGRRRAPARGGPGAGRALSRRSDPVGGRDDGRSRAHGNGFRFPRGQPAP